jgi:glyoxylate/hydroxypyruvate reductase
VNILLSGQWRADDQAAWQQALQAALPAHRVLVSRGEVADAAIAAAIVANPAPAALAGLPGLRLIQSLWAGVERLLADPTLPADVPIARMVDPAMNQAMAETALWATLSLHRGFPAYARQQADACWQPLPQRRADEVPVLVLGGGQMGGTAAEALARQGYPVTVWRRSAAGRSPDGCRAIAGMPALRAALPQAQVVINLLPLTPQTAGLIDYGFLAALPPDAGLVNLARGAHVVDADLLAALDAGALGHAVLDVFQTEPLPADHRYWRHPRVTVLPHAAAMTDHRSAAAMAARNIEALAQGAPLAHLVARDAGY